MGYTTVNILKRVLLLSRPYWLHVVSLFLLSLLSTPIALLKPLALKILIDSAFGSHPIPWMISALFPANFEFNSEVVVVIAVSLMVLVALIDNVLVVFNWIFGAFVGEKLVLRFRMLLFNHMQRISLAYHDSKGSSDSLYRIQWDTMSIRNFLLGNLSPLLTAIITLVAMVTVMFLINWHFLIIALCLLPPLFVLTRTSTKQLLGNWKKVKDDESAAMSVVHEVLGALRVVKSFGQEKNEEVRFVNQSEEVIKGQLKLAWIGAAFNFVISMLFTIGTALFFYLGAKFVQSGEMTIGDLTLVFAYLGQIFWPLHSISKNLNDIQSSVASIERVFVLLDKEKEVEENPRAIHLNRATGAFEYQHVSFSYENNKPALYNISFKIKAGERVGIMGSTGAGKSTLVSLLMRFYDPISGSILIDGVDIRTYRLTDYRKQFSIVLQEPVLFSTSIGENIRYGRPGANEKDIIEAAIAANAHDFIMKCQDGYNTLVGERGIQLSGGERQRISLARAFIKDAPVLILDEPTSSLDMRTEAQIMEAMERLMAGRTTFMITHRIDTLANCKVILRIENGELVEVVSNQDTHSFEKMKKNFLSMENAETYPT
jgi:ATP-binding cassette, subfamily B, bacterial